MSAKLTLRDVADLRNKTSAEIWAEINRGIFPLPKIVRGQKRWTVTDVIRSREPDLVIETIKGRIA